MDLPGACVEDFERKINKSKLKLVLTNGKIRGYDWAGINSCIVSSLYCDSKEFITLAFAIILGRKGVDLVTLMEQDALLSFNL